MVENSGLVVCQLEVNCDKFKVDKLVIVCGDVLVVVQSVVQCEFGGYSLVFIDLLYYQGWLEKVLLVCMFLFMFFGLVYVEVEYLFDGEQVFEWMQDWEVVCVDKVGMVFYYLL